ncbi:MAG: hypothetical protein JJU37_11770 [Balneolaceae bacterium]|nr:hypothetical protein [Balneolaceae bacterium]
MMELTINKKKITQAIAELPEDATVEQAIERLIVLHKIEKGLKQDGGQTQQEVEQHFKKRKENRTS